MVQNLIKQYKTLKDNWDDNGAIAPGLNVLVQVDLLLEKLTDLGIAVYHAAPGPLGEIMLDVRDEKTKRGIEIICYENRNVYITINENEEMKQGDFEIQILPELIQWLQKNS